MSQVDVGLRFAAATTDAIVQRMRAYSAALVDEFSPAGLVQAGQDAVASL